MSNETVYLNVGELLEKLQECRKFSQMWLTPAEVGEELGLHINTVYRMIQKGELPVYNCSLVEGTVRYKVKREDLQEYMERRKVEGVEEVDPVGQ